MVSLIQDYEQQYAILTAEITADIGRLARLPSGKRIFIELLTCIDLFMSTNLIDITDEKDAKIRIINNHIDEVQELVNTLN